MKFFAVFAAVLAISAAAPTTQWTLHDLSQALQNPATPAGLVPYLEQALNTMMEAVFAGQDVGSVVVPTPVGLLPIEAVVAPSPAIVMPVEVAEPVAPVVAAEPTPAVIADASGSPLVQIIVNIKSQEAVAETPATVVEAEESPILVPSPIIVEPEIPEIPEIVIISPTPIIPEVPEAVVIAPELPETVVVAPELPVIVSPEMPVVVAPEFNPIDVIAVVAPEANPIDLLQPVPVAVAGGASHGILV